MMVAGRVKVHIRKFYLTIWQMRLFSPVGAGSERVIRCGVEYSYFTEEFYKPKMRFWIFNVTNKCCRVVLAFNRYGSRRCYPLDEKHCKTLLITLSKGCKDKRRKKMWLIFDIIYVLWLRWGLYILASLAGRISQIKSRISQHNQRTGIEDMCVENVCGRARASGGRSWNLIKKRKREREKRKEQLKRMGKWKH